ncbi:hypothetical protein JX266_013592 [Neoarthrinium moseri]|nr:hypothetical protein JX266_013592 [Neoarthrinium moseri]
MSDRKRVAHVHWRSHQKERCLDDADRVVEALCSSDATRHLEGTLRSHDINGQILIYALADSRAFFMRIGIDNTSQQIAIIGAIAKACADHPPPKRKCDEHNAAYGENKKRRLQPQNLVPRPTASHTARRYLPDAASQRWDILNPTTEDDNHEEFVLWGAAPGLVGHRRRISKLLRLCFMGRRPQPRGQKYQADKIDRPYDPADCEVLPAYGESSDEYDSETWEEIQQEQNEPARACAPDNAPLSEEEVGSILDSCARPRAVVRASTAPPPPGTRPPGPQNRPASTRPVCSQSPLDPRGEAGGGRRRPPPSPASACDSLCAAGDEHDQDGEEIESDLEDCDYRRRPAAPGSARAPTPDGPPSPSPPSPRALPRPDPMVIDLTGDSDEEAPPALASPEPKDSAPDDAETSQAEALAGRFANRGISDKDWASLCRLFQMDANAEAHRPAGFRLALSSYQLHAIW